MNKQLVKDNKQAFEHWLKGGSVVYKTDIWFDEPREDIFDSCRTGKVRNVVINDEYVEFRKAVVEGRTIQYNPSVSCHNTWDDVLTPDFCYPVKDYRIKPEPEFHKGDWVFDHEGKLWQYNGVTDNLGMCTELWDPEPGELCVFWSNDEHFVVTKYARTVDNFHVTTNGEHFSNVAPCIYDMSIYE